VTARRLALLCLLVLAACSTGPSGLRTVDEEAVPFNLLDAGAPPAVTVPPASSGTPFTACLLDAADRIVPVPAQTPGTLTPLAALRRLLPDEVGTTARTALPDGAPVRAVEVSAGVARVALSPDLAALGADRLPLAIGQVVCTLTGLPGIGQVTFRLDDAPVEVPTASGSLTALPVSRDDYAALLAPA
jgi:hypothetical protein